MKQAAEVDHERRLPGWIRGVDRLSAQVGVWMGWAALAMILIGAFNALARYAGRWFGASLSSNAYLEMQWYLFSAVFLLGASYGLSRGSHVRVDVLYSRFSVKTQARVDFLGSIFFLLPFVAVSMWLSWGPIARSWQIREQSPDPGGLARYPIKTVILIGFVLLFIQGVAEVAKSWIVLRGGETGENAEPAGAASREVDRVG